MVVQTDMVEAEAEVEGAVEVAEMVEVDKEEDETTNIKLWQVTSIMIIIQ